MFKCLFAFQTPCMYYQNSCNVFNVEFNFNLNLNVNLWCNSIFNESFKLKFRSLKISYIIRYDLVFIGLYTQHILHNIIL